MRISDWSSDVCSSDLIPAGRFPRIAPNEIAGMSRRQRMGTLGIERMADQLGFKTLPAPGNRLDGTDRNAHLLDRAVICKHRRHKLGRASCRERVCPYV